MIELLIAGAVGFGLYKALSAKPVPIPSRYDSQLYPSASKRDPTKYFLHDMISKFPHDEIGELSLAKRQALMYHATWWAVEGVRDTAERELHALQTLLDRMPPNATGCDWKLAVEQLLATSQELCDSCVSIQPRVGDPSVREAELLLQKARTL